MPTRLIIASLVSLVLAASAVAWTPEAYLSPEFAGVYGDPAAMFDAVNRLHVVYMANPANQSVHLYYRMFDGLSWSAAVDLPGPNYKEPECAAAMDATGRIQVVGMYRADGTTNTPYTIYYWSYNGVNWTGPTMISSGEGNDGNNCSSPKIAVDQNNDVHVVWAQDGLTGGESDILYRKMQAGVWQAIQNVTANGAGTSYGSVSPDLAVDRFGSTVHLVWHDDFLNNGFQAYYTKNTNLGDSGAWLSKSQWFQLSTGDYGKTPAIVLDRSDNPHTFWADHFGGTESRLGYRRWTGSGWTSAANWGAIDYEGAAFDSANLMRFIYKGPQAGLDTLELWHRVYDPAASTFTTPELVSAGGNTLKVDFATIGIDYYGYSNLLWSERKGEWPGVGGLYYSAQALPQPPPMGPSGTLTGLVRDQFGVGIVGARVFVAAGWQCIAGASGAYSLNLPVGPQSVSATKDFYATRIQAVSISQNQTTAADFVLDGQPPAPLAALTVTEGNTWNQITWRAPTSTNLSGLVIRYKLDGPPSGPNDGALLLDGPILGGTGSTISHDNLPNGQTVYYAGFTYFAGASRYYAAGVTGSGTPAGPADFDRDGDVDQADFGAMQICLTGAFAPQNDPACGGARLDNDDDVDDADVLLFIGCISRPDEPSDPGCLP